MTAGRGGGEALWRVGYAGDPLEFAPLELYEFSHRFDDLHRRFRTLYFAEEPRPRWARSSRTFDRISQRDSATWSA